MKCTLIVPAAGRGRRFESSLPKQFLKLCDVPILIQTLRIFDNIDEIVDIIIPTHKDYFTQIELMVKEYEFAKKIILIEGGNQRQDSVKNAIDICSGYDNEIILIHDAVRPFASTGLVRRLIETASIYGAAIPAVEVKDTTKSIDSDHFVTRTMNRSVLRSVQTPQVFRKEILIKSFDYCYANNFIVTDDASMAEAAGFQVKVIDGEETNFKITTPLDFALGEIIMQNKNISSIYNA